LHKISQIGYSSFMYKRLYCSFDCDISVRFSGAFECYLVASAYAGDCGINARLK